MPAPYGYARRSAVVTAVALAALVAQPLVASPSYAGTACGTPLPIGDCTPPETTITDEPAVDGEGATESTDAAFTFESQDEDAGDPSTFACKLDGPSQAHDWSDCTDATQSKAGWSTGSKSYAGLTPGSYTFSVRATDTPDNPLDTPNTDPTPATFSWTVLEPSGPDTDAPDTTITAGADRWWPSSFLGITYASSEPEAGWRCTLNGEPRTCDSNQLELLHLTAGDYRFTVAAVDTAGNVDQTPAVERWTVPMNDRKLKTVSRQWDQRTGRGYFQDSYSITDARGAFIEQGKRGFRSLVLVATKCPGCGKVVVYLKGDRLDTVNLSAKRTKKRQVIPIASWAQRHAGKVRLEVRTAGKDVIIEGLGFSARR